MHFLQCHCLYTTRTDSRNSGKLLTLHCTNLKLNFITKLIIYITRTGYSIPNITKHINKPHFGLFHNLVLGSVSSPSVPPIPKNISPRRGEQCLVQNSPTKATSHLKFTCNNVHKTSNHISYKQYNLIRNILYHA